MFAKLSGYKTYLAAALLGSLTALKAAGLITAEQEATLYPVLVGLLGAALRHAIAGAAPAAGGPGRPPALSLYAAAK